MTTKPNDETDEWTEIPSPLLQQLKNIHLEPLRRTVQQCVGGGGGQLNEILF